MCWVLPGWLQAVRLEEVLSARETTIIGLEGQVRVLCMQYMLWVLRPARYNSKGVA
jgi:hypothetical protein